MADYSDCNENLDISREGNNQHKSLSEMLLEDIQICMRSKYQRRNPCLFYHLVQGGNTNAVGDFIKFLNDEHHLDELRWILNRKIDDHSSQVSRCVHRFIGAVVLMFTGILFMITTPLFYLLHHVSSEIYRYRRRSISTDPDLSLLFALYSGDPEMVRLFLDHGVSVADTDANHNNIYHYISDVSVTDPEQAISHHKLIKYVVKDIDALRQVILKQENNKGLSPLEMCARWGSMKLLHHLVTDWGILCLPLVSVSKDSVTVSQDYLMKAQSQKYLIGVIKKQLHVETYKVNSGSDASEPGTGGGESQEQLHVAEYDLERYESGDVLGRQSYLLQLISARRVEQLTDDDIDSFRQIDFLHCWMRRKYGRFVYQCIASHAVHILVTVLLLMYLLHFGGDMNPFPLLEDLVGHYMKVSIEMMSELTTTTAGDMSSLVTWSDVDNIKLDDLMSVCHRDTQIIGDFVLNKCLAEALREVMGSCKNINLQGILHYSGIKLFFTDVDQDAWTKDQIVAVALKSFMTLNIAVDILFRFIFMWRNFTYTTTFPYISLWTIITRRMPGSYIERQLVMLMYCLFVIYQFYYRYFINSLSSYLRSLDDIMQSAHWVMHNQGNVKISSTMSSQFLTNISDPNNSFTTGNTPASESVLQHQLLSILNHPLHAMSYLLTSCLILRFLLIIHAMRLLPSVGFFVITARKMGQHLLQFVLVFMLVALAFATIFHFVMRDEKCPAKRIEGFVEIGEGLFSTYLIALGHSSFQYFDNVNAQIAFIVYTIITVLLLFNLVIAVMSSTADTLNRRSCRETLCMLEIWDEILGMEASCQVIKLPFVGCMECTRWCRGTNKWKQNNRTVGHLKHMMVKANV